MEKVFARMGDSLQQIGGQQPEEWVEMNAQRPGPNYVASSAGDWVEKLPVPPSIKRRQGRLALLEVGKLDAVESAIAAIEDPTGRRAAQIEYEADTWERLNAFLMEMWAQLGGTEAELDSLFVIAETK